ncbi:MAG TPA: sialidase family protein, partial [Vicinamibacterales bacterium]|nr:sialidase family protein [Vicinamibacterales bacterium]
MSAGIPAAQRAGGPGPAPNESDQLPVLTAPVRISADYTIKTIDAQGASYPRVLQLQHYVPGKGQLLLTFTGGGAGGGMPIYRSTDNGETFQLFSQVPDLRGQPALYELPVKMGEFPAGTIMAAGGRPSPDPAKRLLALDYSTDGGKTWQYLSTYAEGGPGRYDPADRAGLSLNQNPVFEPYLYADARNRLVVYFSDERYKKDGHSQLLDHRVSEDGGRTWGDLVFDVAIPDGLVRPGMATIARAGNGKFYMTYEMVSMPGYQLEPRTNPVYFKVSDDGD